MFLMMQFITKVMLITTADLVYVELSHNLTEDVENLFNQSYRIH